MRHKMMTAMAALALAAAPALAAFRIMPAGTPQLIRNSTLTVTPGIDWNRLGPRLGRNAEAWTLDGHSLNDLNFYAGVADGATLFREVDRRNRPLPRFSATMLAPEIVQIFESTYRVAARTSLFEVGEVSPATFAGHPGVRFTYRFTIQDEEVRRNGEATGAVIGGKLYLISYEAPAIHYFARNLADYRAIVASATLAAGAPPRRR